MIEFKGTLSNSCIKRMQREENRKKIGVFGLYGIVISAPFVLLAIYTDIIFLVALPVTMLIAILAIVTPTPAKFFPDEICIDGENLYSAGEGYIHSRSLYQVKKVIDFGDWYQIIFFFPHKSQVFICQKDLLVQGSIEEFEKIFDGLIEPCK